MPRTTVPSKIPSANRCSQNTPKSQASSSISPVKQKHTRSKKIKVSNDPHTSGVYSSIYKSTTSTSSSLQAPRTQTQTPSSSAVDHAVELTTHPNTQKQQQRTLKNKNKHISNHKNSIKEGSKQNEKIRVVLTKNKRRHSMLKIYGLSICIRFHTIISN